MLQNYSRNTVVFQDQEKKKRTLSKFRKIIDIILAFQYVFFSSKTSNYWYNSVYTLISVLNIDTYYTILLIMLNVMYQK